MRGGGGGGEIPRLIQRQLDEIAQNSDTGSVVIVPAFNRFPEGQAESGPDCCDRICETIAKHFFVAIAQERLTVSVHDSTDTTARKNTWHLRGRPDVNSYLSRDTIRNEKRRRKANQLVAGSRINAAWQTYCQGKEETLQTSFGAVKARIRYTPDQITRIGIVRAGMFITDDSTVLPRSHFAGKKAFSAVLLFAEDPKTPNRADRILRAAEDSGHSRILDRMREGEGQYVPNLFAEIREGLKNVLEDVEASRTHVPEILPIRLPSHRASAQPQSVIPQEIKHDANVLGNGDERETDHVNRPGKRKKRGKKMRTFRPRIPVRTSVVPGEANHYEVEIRTPPQTRSRRNVYLRLVTKTGSDGTCDSPLQSRPVRLDRAQCQSSGKTLDCRDRQDIVLGTLPPNIHLHLSIQIEGESRDPMPIEAVLYEGDPAS